MDPETFKWGEGGVSLKLTLEILSKINLRALKFEKKDEKIEKKILTLFERTRIGRVVERSWKKSLEKVKNHKKAIYAKTFLPLFERTGPEIGQDVETSWKKSLKMVKIHKKAIYAKTFSFTKKSLMG